MRILRGLIYKELVFTLKDGSTWEGVLVKRDREAFMLQRAKHLVQGADRPIPVDGELILLRSEVRFIQVP